MTYVHTWEFGGESTHGEGHEEGQQTAEEEADPPRPHPAGTAGGQGQAVNDKRVLVILIVNHCKINSLTTGKRVNFNLVNFLTPCFMKPEIFLILTKLNHVRGGDMSYLSVSTLLTST